MPGRRQRKQFQQTDAFTRGMVIELKRAGLWDAQRYVDDVLRPVTPPYLQGIPNDLYQQDNARPHTARISQQALQDVHMLPWLPYSPDLSPIEPVWYIIGRRLHALLQPRSENELWQMCYWNENFKTNCLPKASRRRARLNWCLEHHAWTHDQWANVLFSDESRFSLNTDSRRVFIWREPGTRYHPSNIMEIDSFRGGSLLVWAGISSSRRTPLHFFSGGTLTAQRYRDEILKPYLRPYRDQIGHNLIFMDDNARPHRARLVNEYLQSENIRRMDWPARSPDLNPIEHVWDALGRRIGARHPSPRTLVELRTAHLEEWGLLPLDLLQSLVNSMRARCETLIAVRGDHTPY
ncbi:hypothetical protein LAZ67_2005910 [Cordylochernes scorpioides]|uniref:Tc1-like transposase DDE domain-containing protein n=1 Tax=Cordylochernes scorpioides TaxID=51811 RepID=A0ABY6K4V3_9ARAC|nr:hypothetical protein LAZ67_2005910 [Cordylochernes scorpioides]